MLCAGGGVKRGVRTLYKAGVQGGRGGKSLASVRQKANHRKENLRRWTELVLGRETYAAGTYSGAAAQARTRSHTMRREGEPTEVPRGGSVVRPQDGYNTEILSHLSPRSTYPLQVCEVCF